MPPPGRSRPYLQLDVFGLTPFAGNPLAVVGEADGLSEAQMAGFARWTNLSETTFLLAPTDARADYRVRIFTPEEELPFAGHPTLGSAAAWLSLGGVARDARIIQECGAGLVAIRREEDRLWFAAPPLRRRGDVAPEALATLLDGLGLAAAEIVAANWVDNGPGWVALLLASHERLLAVRADPARLDGWRIGLAAACPEDGLALEVRALLPGSAVAEDPVTGSLNAGLGQWLIAAGLAPDRYVACQGRVLGRNGRVHVRREAGEVWVGGATTPGIEGRVTLRG